MSHLNKLVLTALLAISLAGFVAAHPPTEPDHGLNESEFVRLWSEDTGSPVSPDDSVSRFISGASDYSYTDPPKAPEVWNRGEFGELSGLDFRDPNKSIYPADADLDSSRIGAITDASLEIFSVNPSVFTHRSPIRGARHLGEEGSILVVVDYRVPLPPEAELLNHEIERTWIEGSSNDTSGSHTPVLSYDLDDLGTAQGLVVRSTISARIRAEFPNGSVRTFTDTVTVSENLILRNLFTRLQGVRGIRVNYPDGSKSIVLVGPGGAWRGAKLPGGEVRTRWRYFTTKDDRWEELVVESQNGSRTRHSPAHPVTVHAYPSENGPRALSSTDSSLPKVLRVLGTRFRPPDLPDGVKVNVVEDDYTEVWAVEAKYDPNASNQEFRYMGLTRGSGGEVTIDRSVDMRRTELDLEVIDETSTHVTIRVSLREKESGRPIRLEGRAGYVELMGSERVNTSSDGTARTIIRKPNDYVRAEYVPGAWWDDGGAFMSSTATLAVGNEFVGPLGIATGAFRIFGFLLPFLAVVFMLDRMLGLDLWPPWKKI